MKTLSPEFIEKLKSLAKEKAWNDNQDFSPYDYSGIYADAYYGGRADGEIGLARYVLDQLGISYKE
jgi:hypothetical protein